MSCLHNWDMKDTFADTKINQLYDWKPNTKIEEGMLITK